MIIRLNRTYHAYHFKMMSVIVWSLEERRNRADLIEVFKMVKGLSGMPMEFMFEFPPQSTSEVMN